jgi:hypothetical protein
MTQPFDADAWQKDMLDACEEQQRAEYLGFIDGAHRWCYPRREVLARTNSTLPLPEVKSRLRFHKRFYWGAGGRLPPFVQLSSYDSDDFREMSHAARQLEQMAQAWTDPVVIEVAGPDGEQLVWNHETQRYEDTRTPEEVAEDEVAMLEHRLEFSRAKDDLYSLFVDE